MGNTHEKCTRRFNSHPIRVSSLHLFVLAIDHSTIARFSKNESAQIAPVVHHRWHDLIELKNIDTECIRKPFEYVT